MNRLMEQLGVSESLKISAIIKVDELLDHEMIYIYHHLEVGDQLILKLRDVTLKGDLRYDVYYKNYHLGAAIVGGIIRSFYEGEKYVTAEISGLSKNKYMPIQSLDIRIGVNALKKAV